MRIIHLTLALAVLAGIVQPKITYAADGASIHAILITASNAKTPPDARLAPYETALQRNLPESSFRYVGEGSASLAGNGRAIITLGQGHRVELERDSGAGDRVRMKLQWMNGSAAVMSTTVALPRGVPVVLGRRPSGDGDVPIVLVMAR